MASTPYSSAMRFVAPSARPTWVNPVDQERLASYDLYDDLYWNNPDSFQLMLRGSDDKPIYIPSAKRIVNTMSRYVARGFGFAIDETTEATPEQRLAVTVAFGELFKREDFISKFHSEKKCGIRRGDWLFYIYANPLKAEGTRISIKGLDPRTYFPIEATDDPDRIIGQQIVEQIREGDTNLLRVQRWLKWEHPEHPQTGNPTAPISYDVRVMEITGWESDADRVIVRVDQPPILLGPLLTSLPIYHIKNQPEQGNPFGSSEIRGLESIIAGINQSASDEDLSLAMAGLGLYWTDSGAPVDEDGEETDWVLGPKRVVEVGDGKTFGRVPGITTVEPFQDHIAMLKRSSDETLGISDVALGQVDTTVAESGIALTLRMGPIIDAAEETDSHILGVMNQMFHDLRTMWFPSYESALPDVPVIAVVGPKLPRDKDKDFDRLNGLHLDGVIPTDVFVDLLRRDFGFDFPEDMVSPVAEAQQAQGRLQQEAEGATGDLPEDV